MKHHDREVKSLLDGTLTVGELREMLADYDDDTPVVISNNYGDYHNTEQVLKCGDTEDVTSLDLCKSGYSRSRVAFCDYIDQDFYDENELEEMDEEERKEALKEKYEKEDAAIDVCIIRC